VSWLALVGTVLALLRSFVEWLHDRQTIDAAAAQAALKGLQDANAAIENALRERQQVHDDIERNSADLMSDDGFRRPE
jgi:hypothetical protein